MDYEKVLDIKTKRHVLLTRIEELYNKVKYYTDEKTPEEGVELLEQYYTHLDSFFEQHKELDIECKRDF